MIQFDGIKFVRSVAGILVSKTLPRQKWLFGFMTHRSVFKWSLTGVDKGRAQIGNKSQQHLKDVLDDWVTWLCKLTRSICRLLPRSDWP